MADQICLEKQPLDRSSSSAATITTAVWTC